MAEKLKCVLIDADLQSHRLLKNLCKGSPTIELTHSFTCPKQFINSVGKLKFDFCLLDIHILEPERQLISNLVKNKPVIFLTDTYDDRLREVINFAPIDIVNKPIEKEQLNLALERVNHFPIQNKDKRQELFRIKGRRGKWKLKLAEIAVVKTDTIDPRNKRVIMKDAEIHILRNYTFEYLLGLSNLLVRVNKCEIIGMDFVREVRYNSIILNGIMENGEERQVPLSRAFKKNFMQLLMQNVPIRE